MCGRYQLKIKDDELGKKIKSRCCKLNLLFKEGEVFPSEQVLCLINTESKIDLAIKTWGIKKKSLIINARLETINEKIAFKDLKDNRCAIICNGFYEWDKDKKKYYLSFNEQYVYLACIYNNLNELVILTKQSEGEFLKIHERIPIVMNKEEMKNYLNNIKTNLSKKDMNIELVDSQINLF